MGHKSLLFRALSPILALAIGATLSPPAAAMTAKTKAYLSSIGIDPSGADVRVADADGAIRTTFRGDPAVFSLDKLADARQANAVRRFIFTRSLIRKIKANEAAFQWPNGGYPDYDGQFLTPAERTIVLRKIL